MNNITKEHCFNHFNREAVARCPQCKRFFCRECVTEHDDMVICAGCLKLITEKLNTKEPKQSNFLLTLKCVATFMALWLIFFSLGQILLMIPSSFHDGTLWKNLPWSNF